MRAKDLRIGNYIYAEVGLPIMDIHKVQVGDFNGIYSGQYDINPIIFDEWWIRRFKLADKFGDKLVFGPLELMFNEELNHYYIYFQSKIVVLEYVHQIQNLYYSLSGKELIKDI